MIGSLGQRFGAMTRRERLLVAGAGLLTALFVLVYGIVLPVGHAFDAAQARHAESAVRTARLVQALQAMDGARRRAGGGPVGRMVATSAEQAGLVLQSNQPKGDDETQIIVPSASAAAVLGWIDALGQRGIAVDGLTISPTPQGTVAVAATLRRPAS